MSIKKSIKIFLIQIYNLLLFALCVLWNGTPPHLWRRAWRGIQADHLAQIRKDFWELKQGGRIYEDKQGYLWSKRK